MNKNPHITMQRREVQVEAGSAEEYRSIVAEVCRLRAMGFTPVIGADPQAAVVDGVRDVLGMRLEEKLDRELIRRRVAHLIRLGRMVEVQRETNGN